MDRTEIERVAGGLSEAGKEALDWVRPASLIAPYRAGADEIESLKLVTRENLFFRITPFGVAVRNYILEQDK